jgi:transcriptional regulator with XRE-family HTH domain
MTAAERFVRARALEAGLTTLRDLATASGVTYPTLRTWLDGSRDPRPENLSALASILGVDAARLASFLARPDLERKNADG